MVRYTEGQGLCSHCRTGTTVAECAICRLRVCDACSNPRTCSQPKTVRYKLRRGFLSRDRVIGFDFGANQCLLETLFLNRLVYDLKKKRVVWSSKRTNFAQSGPNFGTWLDGLTNSSEMVQALHSIYDTKSFVLQNSSGEESTVFANYDGKILDYGFSANSAALWTLQSSDTVIIVDLEKKTSKLYDPLPRQALRRANVDFEAKRMAVIAYRHVAVYSFGESLTKEASKNFDREPREILIYGNHVVLEFGPDGLGVRAICCYLDRIR